MADHVDALTPAGVFELATFIIRPPRAHYSRADLGERSFSVDATPASREDLTLVNSRGLRLHCSHFRPHHTSRPPPTLVYLHGNGSCRVDATVLLPLTIPYGIALFAFDFSGSGRSDGEYISLGVWERLDVDTVVSHLVRQRVDHILLWGHSMGAATALMYAGLCARTPTVKAIVLDSPFASFDKLAQSLVADMALPRGLPRKLVLTVGVRAVRKLVRERAGFDVNDIDPLSASRSIPPNLPALFMHGTADAVVPISHGQLLYDNFPTPIKHWLPLPNLEHDSPRPESAMDQAFVFMQRHMRNPSSLDFLEALKARGNVAMLSSRFTDAIFLYTHALDALAESLATAPAPQHTSARRRHHIRPIIPSTSPDSLVRRNSSFPNILTSVKRWRHRASASASASASAAATDDEDDAAIPFRPPRQSRFRIERSYRASTDLPVPAPSVERIVPTTSPSIPSPLPPPPPSTTPPSKSGTTAGDDDARSDTSARNGRFERQRSWRARGVVNLIRRRVRGTPLREQSMPPPTPPSSTPPPNTDVRSRSAHSAPVDIPNGTAVEGEESRRSSRSSRSSSHVRLRHRARRERLRRFRDIRDVGDRFGREELGHTTTSTKGSTGFSGGGGVSSNGGGGGIGTGGGKWFSGGSEAKMWRGLSSRDSSGLKSRFSSSGLRRGASRLSARTGIGQNGRTSTDANGTVVSSGSTGGVPNGDRVIGVEGMTETRKGSLDGTEIRKATTDVREWVLDGGQRNVALALLGNRSLARRKVQDIKGALADATRCLQLDGKWVRGYLRKAAALREDGQLDEAREVVVSGLRHEPHHAGLIDLLHSIERAVAERDGTQFGDGDSPSRVGGDVAVGEG